MPAASRVAAIPPLLLIIIWTAWPYIKDNEPATRDLDAFETHAGHARLTNTFLKAGFMADSIDNMYGDGSPSELELETGLGVLSHVQALLNVKDGGLPWTVQECKSLIWAARWQTARSKEWPGGHEGQPVVRTANIQVVSLA